MDCRVGPDGAVQRFLLDLLHKGVAGKEVQSTCVNCMEVSLREAGIAGGRDACRMKYLGQGLVMWRGGDRRSTGFCLDVGIEKKPKMGERQKALRTKEGLRKAAKSVC